MDAAGLTASASMTSPNNKLVKALSKFSTNKRRLRNPPISLTPSCPLTRPNMLHLYGCCYNLLNPRLAPLSNPTNNYSPLFLTHCSARPNTDKEDNVTEENSKIEPNSTPGFQTPETPTLNQPLSSSSSSSSSNSSSNGLVFDLGTTNSWDSVEIGSPVVKRYLGDEEERWYMWYHGRSSHNPCSDSVGLAVSSNGIHWERGRGPIQSSGETGLVLNCSKDWWAFDTQAVRPCEVVIMSSSKIRASSAVYWLYYTGFSSEKSLPGLAMSQDGRHWARIEGEHHTGALLDVGLDGEWDSLFIASPQVVYHVNGDLRMYYHSFDVEKGRFAIGMARSRDGIRWVKLGKIIGGGANGGFDEFGALNARVVRNNRKDGKYLMVYEGVDASGRRSIGLAVSTDGLKDWTRLQDDPVLKWSEEDGWDDKGVGSPCLVQMDGEADEWRLYYRGIGKGGQMGIGMAVSEGSEIRK
ncbi:hypothetical protein LguiB_016076 [Lonicera macranthoides]